MMDQSVNFTPLSHEELRELWNISTTSYREAPFWKDHVRRAILSAIWWMAMEEARLHIPMFCGVFTATNVPCDLCRRSDRDWFYAKLREVGIDWREDG